MFPSRGFVCFSRACEFDLDVMLRMQGFGAVSYRLSETLLKEVKCKCETNGSTLNAGFHVMIQFTLHIILSRN